MEGDERGKCEIRLIHSNRLMLFSFDSLVLLVLVPNSPSLLLYRVVGVVDRAIWTESLRKLI